MSEIRGATGAHILFATVQFEILDKTASMYSSRTICAPVVRSRPSSAGFI